MANKTDTRKRKSLKENVNNVKCSKLYANSQLLLAISSSRHTEVASLLELSLDQISRKTLETAVFQIVENSCKRLLQIFIKHGVNVNCKNMNGQTTLMVAAQHGCLDLVKLLVRNGAEVNSKAKSGKTALILAAEKACCVPVIEFLVSSSSLADVNIQDRAGRTALMVSTQLCDIAAMRVLMLHGKTNLKIQDRKGNTALDIAKQNDMQEEFCLLQEWNGDHYLNPLMISVARGNLSLLKEFLDDDYYNIDKTNLDGYTPLLLALKNMTHGCKGVNKSKEIIITLLKHGADINKMCTLSAENSCTPLLFAVELDILEAVILLVEHGANINVQTGTGQLSALMAAAQEGVSCILEYLIQKGADVHLKDAAGKVALSYALEKNQIGCADLLLQHGAELDHNNLILAANLDVELDKYLQFSCVAKQIASSKLCDVLMRRCCDKQNYALAEFLFSHGADVSHSFNSLLLSVVTKDVCMATLLLDKGAPVNETNEHGHTALMMAAFCDCGEAIQLLIARKADVSIKCGDNTALTLAIQQHSKNALKALLHCGVDVNYVSKCCRSLIPLHMAISLDDNDVTELLIHYGADVNSVDRKAQTPLLLAFQRENYGIVNLLIAAGADLNKKTIDGCTMLHFALTSQNFKMTEILIRGGADINIPNAQGKTALMVCAQICTTDFMLLLLKNGANVNAVDQSGSSALHYAVMYSILLTEKAELLLKYGADINTANFNGNTAFMIALRFCKDNVLRFLLDHGADPNTRDIFGSTALINVYASQKGRAAFLIDIGADVNIQNDLGKTALIAAVEICDDSSMKELIKAGADVHVVDTKRKCNVMSLLLAQYTKCELCFNTYSECKHYVCIEMLFNAGARPDILYCSLVALYKAIICNKLKLVQFLVDCGVPPLEVSQSSDVEKYSTSHDSFREMCGYPWEFTDLDGVPDLKIPTKSPLTTAMFCKDADICEFFINRWFFNEHDMSRSGMYMFCELVMDARGKLATVCEEVFQKQWSLEALSFVTVSTCVGGRIDREKCIRTLPIPQIFHEKLLFRGDV